MLQDKQNNITWKWTITIILLQIHEIEITRLYSKIKILRTKQKTKHFLLDNQGYTECILENLQYNYTLCNVIQNINCIT